MIRVSHKQKWLTSTLREAIEAIESRGMNIQGAARWYNIPTSSLGDYLHDKTTHQNQGAKGILEPHEEAEVVAWLLRMLDHIGYSVTITQLKLKVTELTQMRVTSFLGGIPKGS